MTTPTPEAIEAAARAINEKHDFPAPLWESLVNSKGRANQHRVMRDRAYARAALTAANPLMVAQAKAEAWDAVIARIDLGTPHMVDEKYVAGANWVRNQIEDVLKPTIEGKSE